MDFLFGCCGKRTEGINDLSPEQRGHARVLQAMFQDLEAMVDFKKVNIKNFVTEAREFVSPDNAITIR